MKSLLNLSSQRFHPMFSSGRFLVLALLFRAMTHFESNFVERPSLVNRRKGIPSTNGAGTPRFLYGEKN